MTDPGNHANSRKATVWRAKILTSTWLSYAGFYFCRKNYTIVKGDVQANLQIDEFQLAHIFTAYLIAYMLGQFMAGLLGRKIAARYLLLGGMAITLVCNIFFGFSVLLGPAGYYPMLALMVVNGFAQATGWPGNVGILGNWLARKERGRVMALWATSYQLGSMMAKAFAAFMLGYLGLTWSFWGASAVMLGVWIVFFFFERDTPEDAGIKLSDAMIEEIEVERTESEAASAKSSGLAGALGWSRAVFFSVIFIGLTYFVFKFCRYALDSWGPMIIRRRFDVDLDTAGYVSLSFDLVGFLGVLFAGWASDTFFKGRRYQMVVLMTIGMFIMTVLIVWLDYPSIILFGVMLALTGFMLMGPDSLLSGAGAIDVGGRRGAILAAGIINGLGSIGPVIQEEAIGWVASEYSLSASLYLLIGAASLGVIGTLYLAHRSRSGLSSL